MSSKRLEARARFVNAVCKARMSAEVERGILEAAAEWAAAWANESAMDAIGFMSDALTGTLGLTKDIP